MPKIKKFIPALKGDFLIFRAPFRACPDEDREFGVIRKIKMNEI